MIKMELRIWDGSPLVGMTVKELEKKYGIKVLRVKRGGNHIDYPEKKVGGKK